MYYQLVYKVLFSLTLFAGMEFIKYLEKINLRRL